jgi:hypothetical protein
MIFLVHLGELGAFAVKEVEAKSHHQGTKDTKFHQGET